MKQCVWILSLLVSILFGAQSLWAQDTLRGVALVIGNGDYDALAPLDNPENDAEAIEALLDELGFETEVSTDRTAKRLRRDLANFLEDAEEADVAFFYYAGHGIEAGGENFLVPVDADPNDAEEADGKLIPLNGFLTALRETVPVAIVLLDACRTNPFPQDFRLQVTAGDPPVAVTAAGLGVPASRGAFAPEAADDTDRRNLATVIGFAAEPGNAALDGTPGTNSPYAAALLRHVGAIEGEDFSTVMSMVAEEVFLKTKGRQQPWVNQSLRRYLYFGSPQQLDPDTAALVTERRQLLVHIAALPDRQRTAVRELSKTGDVPMDLVFAVMRAAGLPKDAAPAIVEARLKTEIGRMADLRARRSSFSSPDAEVQRLTQLADAAEQEGALNTAVQFRDLAKARVDALQDSRQAQIDDLRARIIEDAEVYARSAETKRLLFRYAEAAADYGQAFEVVAKWHTGKAFEHRFDQMNELGNAYIEQNNPDMLAALLRVAETEVNRPTLRWTDRQRTTFLVRAADANRLEYGRTGDPRFFDKAKTYYEQATGADETDRSRNTAAARHGLGQLVLSRSNRSESKEEVARAVEYLREWSQSQGPNLLHATAIRRLEVAQQDFGPDSAEVQNATALLKLLLTPWSTVTLTDYARSLSHIGYAWTRLSAFDPDPELEDKALEAFSRALLILNAVDDPALMANTFGNRARLYLLRAERGHVAGVDLAFRDLHRAVSGTSPQSHPAAYNRAYGAIVDLVVEQGEHLTDEQISTVAGYGGDIPNLSGQPDRISQKIGALILAQAAHSDDLSGYRAALARLEALEQKWDGMALDVAASLHYQGAVYRKMGILSDDIEDLRQSVDHLQRARALSTGAGDTAMSLRSLGVQGASELSLAYLTRQRSDYIVAAQSLETVLSAWTPQRNGRDWFDAVLSYTTAQVSIAFLDESREVGQLDTILSEILALQEDKQPDRVFSDLELGLLKGVVLERLSLIRQDVALMRDAAQTYRTTLEFVPGKPDPASGKTEASYAYVIGLEFLSKSLAEAADWSQEMSDFQLARASFEDLMRLSKGEQALDQFTTAANGLAHLLVQMNRARRNDADLDRALELAKIALAKAELSGNTEMIPYIETTYCNALADTADRDGRRDLALQAREHCTSGLEALRQTIDYRTTAIAEASLAEVEDLLMRLPE